jgi:H+-transporting ATPase
VVRYLAAFNGAVIVIMVGYAWFLKMPFAEIIVLTAILASIPVALPATFTLASALGALALARLNVLPTRLSAVDEAATMDVLCADKTGTLTRNELKVTRVHAIPGFDEAHVLALAALASSDGGQDPVDTAIRTQASVKDLPDLPKLITFVPFDPATKMSKATVTSPERGTETVIKGAYTVVSGLTQPGPDVADAAAALEAQGLRLLAVAVGVPQSMKLAGLIALSEAVRCCTASMRCCASPPACLL